MQFSELTKQIRAAQSAKGVLYQLEVALGHRDGTAADFAFNRRPVQPSGTFRQTRLYEVGANNALIAGSAVDVLERLIRHGTTTSVFYFMGRFAGDYPIYATQRNGDIIMIGSAYYRATEDEPPTYAIRNGTERHAQLLGQLQQDMKHRDKSKPRLVYGKKVDLASAEGEAANLQLLSPVDDEESDVVSVGPSKGRTAFVVTARGDEVETHFTVMEAADLIPSNLADGTVNPDFPQDLQPRDRTRQSSILQISRLSKSLRPAQLADSGLSSHGAPIIGPDRVVESGNGRTLAILRAYAEGNAGGYREHLEQNAQLYGLDSNRISKMREPVLVRVRQTEVDRVKFAKDSNLSDLQGMAPTELARVDAESIDDRLMALFNPSESGDLLAASNRPFVQAFMAKLGTEQAASYMTADGRPTKQIIDRMQAAIFAKAYQNDLLLQLAVEEADPEIRNILTALNVAAPAFVEMRYLSGEAHKQTTDRIGEGVGLLAGEPTDKPINVDEKYPPRPDPVTAPALDLAALATATKEEVIAGLHPGVRYKPNMRATAEAGIASGVINLGDEFFTRPAELREGTLIHELSHYDAANIGEQVAIDMAQAGYFGPMNGGTVASGPNGQFIPDECLTETIALYKQGEHTYLKERYPKAFEVAQSYMQTGKIARELLVDIAAGAKAYQDEIKAADAKIELAKIVLKKRHEVEPEGPEKERIGQIFTNVWITGEITPEAQTLLDEEAAKVPPVPASSTLDKQALAALVDAATVIREAKASGQDVGEYLSQMGLFGDIDPAAAALAKFIAGNNRSAKRMGAAFKALAEEINAELQHQGAAAGDMFGGAAVDLPAILARVSERMAEETGGQVSLFESVRESHQLAIEAANTMPHLLAILDSLASADPGRELIPFRKAIEDGSKASTVKEAEQAMELWLTALSIRGMNWKPTNIGELFPPAWQVTKAGSEGFMYALSIKTAVLRAQEHRDSLSGFDELQRRRSAVERDLVTLRTLPATPDDWLTLIMGKPYAEADLWKELEHNAQRRLDGEIDSYLPRIEAITVEAKELSPMDLAESALDDQFIEAMMESTREVKAYLAKAPDQVATARLMATNARRNVRGGMAPAQAFQIAAQGLYDHSSHPYRKEAVRAANAMYRSLAQALKQEEERAVDASSLRQLVDEVIAGSPLSDSDARDMVAKTKIRVTSARLASGYSLPNLRSDLADFYKMTNGKIEPPELSFTNKRASAFHKENRINTGSNLNKVTLWHELGHLLENRHPALLDQSRRLLLRRKNAIKNGPAVLPLRKLVPNLKYGPQEKALNDGFFDYYVGKLYGCQNDNNPMQATSTEVLSMGLQCLASDAGLLVLKKDPEHFALTLAALKYLQEDN